MAKVSKKDVLSYLEEANMLEISELISDIEEKFGVSAAAPVAVAGVAAPAAGAAAPAAALLAICPTLDLVVNSASLNSSTSLILCVSTSAVESLHSGRATARPAKKSPRIAPAGGGVSSRGVWPVW